MFTKLTRDLHKNTISISACVLVLALICGVFGIASMQTDSTLAEKPQPGTRAYYDARWEEAKVKAGNKLAGTPYTSHDGVSMTTAAEGPWRLDLREDYLAGKISAPWDGVAAGTAMTVADTVTGAAYNATTNPYKVTTAEQFRWCIVNRRSFILQNDIDLGGYLGRNWTTTTATSAVWSAEGGGHTVYNFYMNAPTGGNAALFSSMTGNSYATQVNNMRISHSYIKDSSAGQTAFFAVTAGPRTMNNCAVENSMASTPAGADDRYLTGFVRNGFTITDSYTRNVHLYNRGLDNGNGTAHVAGFLMPSGYEGMATVVTDCFAVDGTVISNGGHSGGFVSCSNPLSAATITNCFTGMEIYGNKQVGAFLGIIGHGTIRMNNCFATGILEGKLELGGFGSKATSNAADGVTAAKRFNSCYTTASVGMESGGTDIGGFASEVGLGSDYYTDCYAAGEVGSIDTNVSPDRQNDSKNVGGFLGTYNNSTTSYRFTNCFYDKQTTGMKQWATGSTASSGANWGGYTSDWLQAQTVANKDLKGVLTTDTDKSGTGLTSAPNSNTASDGLTNASFTGFSDNDKWVFEKDHYPQLKVFALPTTFTNTNWMSQTELSDLVKAYSRASTATAKLETWDKGFTYDGSAPAPVLGKEVYDTVRDLTRKFYNTTTQGDLPSIDHSVNHALFTAVPTALNGSDIPYGIDGVATSSWASSGNNTLPWYQVDLGTEMPVKKINITWPTTANRALNYRLQTSNDGVAFTDVLTVTGATTGINLHELPATVNARYVRMQTDQKAGAATSAIRIHEFLVDGMVTARASGISGAANYPANALKDDATFWRAANVPNPWLIVDMGGVKPVDRIEIDWPPASTSDNNRATSYEIKLSNNDMSDADWLALPADHIYTGNAGGTNYISLPGKTARYIQIYATAKGASAATIQISGFRVYGDNGATSALSTSWAKGSLVDPNYRDDQALFTAVPTASGGSNIPYAVDGNETTTTSYWQADNVVNAWYQLDLRKRMPLSKMRIVWPSTTTNRATDYEIRVSSDNVSWNTVYTYSAANGGALNPGGVNEITLPPGTTGRYVRMYALSRVGTAAIRIFEFWVDGMVTATASTTNALANSPVVALQENATEWISTNVTAAPFPWYQVDLGSVKPVERVEINWPTTTNRAATYYIQTSTDGINFTNAPVVGSASGGLVTGTTGLNVHDFPAVNAKYIRMQTQTKAASGATIRISNFRVFSPYAATSNDGSELIPATVDLWGETGLEVLYLGQDSGGYFCKDFVPGIEWLHVYADVGGQVASRRMRIIPTAALDPGSGRLISKGSTYDHADEVRMAYSTGPRMNSDMEDVTVGVYPDGPTLADFTEYQEKNQAFPDGNVGTADLADSPKLPLFLGDDNKYIGAYASHMSKTAGDNADTGKLYLKVFRDATVDINNNLVAYSSQIGLDNAGGSSALSAGNNNRFNGIAPFTDTTKTNYLLDYYWELADGRYLQNGKLIYYKELPFNAEINVKTGTETGEQNDEALSLSIGAAANPAFSDTVGHKELEVGSGQQAKISWKFSQGYGPHDITKIILQMTENDDGDMGDPVVINSPRLDGTDTFTVRRTYRRNISLDGVDYLADAIVVDKTYKIMVGTDGGGGTYYYLAFDKAEIVEGLDGRNVMLNDVEDDIIVTIVFADVVHKKNAYLNYSGTAQNGDDENYVKTRNGDYITYEILVDNPPPSGRLEGFKPKLPQPGKINFINGSFEQPVVATTPMFPEDNPWSNAGIETGSYIGCAYYRYSMVDGWYTVPTNPADIGRAHWNCIQYFTGANISWMTYPYPNGYQAAELNAHYPSRLYQIVETVPGTKVYWELYHEAAQGLNGTPHGGGTQSSEESLNVYIYGTPAPGEAGDSSTNRANPPAGTLQATCTTKVSERWKKYTGSYTVPAEQTSTLLAFEAAASYTGSPAHGQYLDGIRIYTNSYIDLIKSNNSDGTVTNGEIVEYEIKAKNLGESDASNVVISDVLPEGTELATGETGFIQINGVNVPNGVYSYNTATRALSVNIGGGATNSVGGFIKGDGSFSADCANEYTLTFKVKVTDDSKVYYENQAKVVYKDRNHEDESDYTNYSNISAFGVKPVQPASVTDKLPDGLTYVGHTDQSGSVSAYNNVTNTVTWQWDDLPYGTTTVTVLVQVEPDSETEFVNKAEVDINGRASETNATYHEILDVTHVKTAHLNEGIANPGTETNPVKVRNNDYITYDILVDNPSPSGESGGFKPKAPRPSKIDFINGSFEQPVISTSSWIQNQSQVNGWFTRPTNPAHLGNPQSEMIEIQKPVSAGGAAGQFAAYAPDGNQYAELNAYVEGTLYQTVDTVPGTKVYWEFYHGARGYIAGNNTDKMNFYLRPEGATTGEPEAVAIDSYVAGSATYNWGHYTGSYVVPPGQTRTEFSFESVSTTSNNTAAGNYLDGIRLYTNSYIDLMKSNNSDGTVTNGEIVEYEIKAKNLGESDASGVVISDVLPAGTELATGETGFIQINGVNVPNGVYSYNTATRALSVNIGAGATNLVGGFIKGDGSFSADCENEYTLTFKVRVTDDSMIYYENQAKVVYKDRNHEDESDYTNYSNISAFGVKPIQPASVTDKLPDGLTYVSHTDSNGSDSNYNSATNTVTWEWDDLPYGTTVVTVLVKVEPDTETEFVNKAEVDINGRTSDTNETYHEILDLTPVKTAHVNEGEADPGTETEPVEVKQDDYITYDILVNNPPPSGELNNFQPKLPQPGKLNFKNGSFEEPVLDGNIVYDMFNQILVDGWNTRPTNPADIGKPDSVVIELQKPVPLGLPAGGEFAGWTPDGNQYAELNARLEGTLYQTVDTIPGTKVYWEFYHGARGHFAGGTNTDVMNFYLRPEGATSGGLQKVASDSYVGGSADYRWGHYTGSYVVPRGQTRTEFSFESVSTTSNNRAIGNYLDGIRLYTNSYIDLIKSNNSDGTVTNGEIVTYTVKAKNLGESDASNVVISDVLPAGTELATGETGFIQIDGVDVPNGVYSYNTATRALSVNIGGGATNSVGGFIKGDGSFSADCENEYTLTFKVEVTDNSMIYYENQAQVDYKDRDHEDESDYTNYSNISAFGVKPVQPASVTDKLPDGLTYVSHTDSNGSTSAYNNVTDTVTWQWADLPYGTTTVTVLVRVNPDSETEFVNKAEVTISGSTSGTNETFHEIGGTYILHLRQVVLGYAGGIMPPMPYKGFFSLENNNQIFGVTADSNKENLNTAFREFMVGFANTSDMEYYIRDIVPQHYVSDGYIRTVEYDPFATGTINAHYPPLRTAGDEAEADFDAAGEYWVTMYIRPMTSPGLNDWDFETNHFGKLYPGS